MKVNNAGSGRVAKFGDSTLPMGTDTVSGIDRFVGNDDGTKNDTFTYSSLIEDRLHITDISNDAKGFFTTSAEDKISFSNVGEPTFKDLLEGSGTGSDGNIAGTFTLTAGDAAGQIGNISFEEFETITFEVKNLKNAFV